MVDTDSAQLMEEELQNSVRISQGDPDYDEEMGDAGGPTANEVAYALNKEISIDGADEDEEEEFMGDEDDDEDGPRLDDEEDASESGSEDDEDAEGEEDDIFEEVDVDQDGDGEEDEGIVARRSATRDGSRSDGDDLDEDDEDEGVGAVKIRPGETDDEDESEGSEIDGSEVSDGESEGAAAWEDAAENLEEEEDEASEDANTNLCLFCKKDESEDPAEEFEAFLTCRGCGENSHQQCAREGNALHKHQDIDDWRCPDCAEHAASDEEDAAGHDEHGGLNLNGIADANAPPARRRASAPKLARDLLPSQKGTIKPDSHSVFNQLVLDEDPMDGSRVLRKRKTSSAEADEDILALRKRRKNTMESNDSTNEVEDGARSQSGRPLRLKIMPATIQKRTRSSILIKMKVDPSELRTILSRKPKGLKKRDRKARSGRRVRRRSEASRSAPAAPPSPTAPFSSSAYTQPFYSFFDKETDETKGKPYGGILDEAEADTSKTMPTNDDRRRFDEAKQKAEEEWKERLRAMQADVEAPVRKSKKNSGPASQIECINFGGWEIDTWYAAPYPEEYSRHRVLYICEFCLKYMNSDYVAWRHKLKCPAKHPPGDEIYRHGSVSVFEVDGRKNPVYCQNLCLLAKLFLGSKTLYYDVEPFLFYVLCEYDDMGYHFVGYFSKEKRASSQNNVSCILTLPIHQRKGYATLLIDFSYLLTRVEQKTGSPEKPLSDMGLVSYRNYWRLIMCKYFLSQVSEDNSIKKGLSISQISEDTGLTPDDVVAALEGLRCLVRDPETKLYAFRVDIPYCREYVAKWESKKYVQLHPSSLTWTPYVMGRSNATNFELGPAITAIAPREDDEDHKAAGIVGEDLARGDDPIEPMDSVKEDETKGVDQPTVLESTEPNETNADFVKVTLEETTTNGVTVNGAAEEPDQAEEPGAEVKAVADEEAEGDAEASEKEDDWITQYNEIPPSRFEVFPPITGRKAERVRTAITRPPVMRTPSTAPRVRPRRPATSSRKSTSKPRSGSSRKPGGTGRGPGRWPKGTKKSDYGNADSGPGFPPGWDKKSPVPLTNGDVPEGGEGQAVGSRPEDTVEVSTPALKGSKSPTKRNGSSGEASASKGRSTPRSSHGAMADVVMADADAEGDEAEK